MRCTIDCRLRNRAAPCHTACMVHGMGLLPCCPSMHAGTGRSIAPSAWRASQLAADPQSQHTLQSSCMALTEPLLPVAWADNARCWHPAVPLQVDDAATLQQWACRSLHAGLAGGLFMDMPGDWASGALAAMQLVLDVCGLQTPGMLPPDGAVWRQHACGGSDSAGPAARAYVAQKLLQRWRDRHQPVTPAMEQAARELTVRAGIARATMRVAACRRRPACAAACATRAAGLDGLCRPARSSAGTAPVRAGDRTAGCCSAGAVGMVLWPSLGVPAAGC
jgi:hypothetical protein